MVGFKSVMRSFAPFSARSSGDSGPNPSANADVMALVMGSLMSGKPRSATSSDGRTPSCFMSAAVTFGRSRSAAVIFGRNSSSAC